MLRLKHYVERDGRPSEFWVNPSHIVSIDIDQDAVTSLRLSTGIIVRVAESAENIADAIGEITCPTS